LASTPASLERRFPTLFRVLQKFEVRRTLKI